FVQEGKLKEGDVFTYQVTAFPLPDAPSAETRAGSEWTIEEVCPSPICGERPLHWFLQAARGVGEPDAHDFPVFIPVSVLQQAEALKTQAQENETGGILIGYLWRDTESPELFAQITALVPAQHTVAQSTRLTFTAETWEAVQAAIGLRGRGEMWLAWIHSHPSRFWCHCPPEAQRQCPLGKQFFSVDDKALHRAVFSRAYHTALVTGDRPLPEGGWEMVHALYGWRDGRIAPRSFYVLDRAICA
ncbi:MAG TPA: hypothetical protein VKT32_03115, partial [Chthonomonadaceae bacterium]|nr:hypothetical protein [Chthonomonadaceae bacterium]